MSLLAPNLALHVCLLFCALGALDGAYGMISPRGAARGPGVEWADGASLTPLRALAAARFTSHAAALAVLWTAPAIGACFAAGIGCGWLGAAAGRAISLVRDHRHARTDLLRIAGALVMGLVLWAPLWLYLKAIEAAANGAYGA